MGLNVDEEPSWRFVSKARVDLAVHVKFRKRDGDKDRKAKAERDHNRTGGIARADHRSKGKAEGCVLRLGHGFYGTDNAFTQKTKQQQRTQNAGHKTKGEDRAGGHPPCEGSKAKRGEDDHRKITLFRTTRWHSDQRAEKMAGFDFTCFTQRPDGKGECSEQTETGRTKKRFHIDASLNRDRGDGRKQGFGDPRGHDRKAKAKGDADDGEDHDLDKINPKDEGGRRTKAF